MIITIEAHEECTTKIQERTKEIVLSHKIPRRPNKKRSSKNEEAWVKYLNKWNDWVCRTCYKYNKKRIALKKDNIFAKGKPQWMKGMHQNRFGDAKRAKGCKECAGTYCRTEHQPTTYKPLMANDPTIEFYAKGLEMLNAMLEDFVKEAIDLIVANEKSRHFDAETSQALTEVINNLKRAKRQMYMEYGHCSDDKCNANPITSKQLGRRVCSVPTHTKENGYKWIKGYCEEETCSAVGEYREVVVDGEAKQKVVCPSHPDKKWRTRKKFSIKKLFKGLLNVGAIVFAVISIIVDPGCAPVAIAAMCGCAQALWDLGEEEVASSWRWLKPSKKSKTRVTPSEVLSSIEKALGSIEFKMNHIRMHEDFKQGLQGLRDVFTNHETKYKVLNLVGRTKYKELRCKSCNGYGNINADELISKPCTDKSIKCEPCDGTGLGDLDGAAHGQKIYLSDYHVVLQTNWNIQQAKREIRDVLHELNSRQKKLKEKMECIDDIVQKKVLETLMKLSKDDDPDALPMTKNAILNLAMEDGAEWYEEFLKEMEPDLSATDLAECEGVEQF